MAEKKVNAAIVGASGYSGEELVRLLLEHPHVNLSVLTSRQYAGQTMTSVFPRFAGYNHAADLKFSSPSIDMLSEKADVVFLALPHGIAAEFAVPLANKESTAECGITINPHGRTLSVTGQCFKTYTVP